MRDVPRIEGTPDPRNTARVNRDGDIDPEKFKKVMKVEESDDTQKRHKRNRAEQEEAEEAEEEKSADRTTPAPGFSALMDETETRDSLFNSAPQSQIVYSMDNEAPHEDLSPFGMISTTQDKNSQKLNSSPGLSFAGSSSISSKDDENEKPIDQKEQIKNAKKTVKKQLTTAIKEAKTTGSHPITSPPPSPTTEAKKKIEEANPFVEGSTAKEIEKSKEVSEKIHGLEPEKKRIETHAAPADTHLVEIEKKKKRAERSEVEYESDKHDDEKDEKKKKKIDEKEHQELSQRGDLPPPLIDSPSLDASAPPSYSRLSSQVYELFERLVGLITIQQLSGNSKTTVTLNMPDSVFHNSEIVLEKFSTAPHTFNVQLLGSPQAVALFEANMNDLVAAFQDTKRAFEINIQRPYLLDKYRYSGQRVRSAQEGDKQGGGNQEQ